MDIYEKNSLLRTVTPVKENSVNAYRAKLCLYYGRTLFAAGIAYVTLILNVLEPGRCNSISFSIANRFVLQELCSSTVCEVCLFDFQNLNSSLCQRIANSPSILFEVFCLILSTYSAVEISLIFLLKQPFLLQYRTLSSKFRVTWLLWELLLSPLLIFLL